MNHDIINASTIAEIKIMVGPHRPELLAKIIGSFLEDTPQQIAAIEAAILSMNAHSIHEAAHRLKSSSISVGADKLAAACFEIETLGKDGHTQHSNLNTKAIKLAFEEAQPFFKQYI